MKEPKKLEIRNRKDYSVDGDLSLSHLNDIGKCHVMTSSYGEVTSASLNKTQVKRVINWLNKWLEFKDIQEDKCVAEGENGIE